jgi:hypothetical protein
VMNARFLIVLILCASAPAFAGLSELRYLTSNYLAFTESQFAQYIASPIFEESRRDCPNTVYAYEEKVAIAVDLRNQFMALERVFWKDPASFNKTVARTLKEFLVKRFSWLEKRQKDYQTYIKQIPELNAGKRFPISYVHTFPEEVRKYREDGLFRQIAVMAVTDYTLLNWVIRELYELLPASEFSRDLRILLRASVSLHSFLLRETPDAGFPEQGFLVDQKTTASKKATGDILYYFSYIAKAPFLIPDLMLGAPQGKRNLIWLTHAEAFQLRAEDSEGRRLVAPLFSLPRFKPFREARLKAEEALRKQRAPREVLSVVPAVSVQQKDIAKKDQIPLKESSPKLAENLASEASKISEESPPYSRSNSSDQQPLTLPQEEQSVAAEVETFMEEIEGERREMEAELTAESEVRGPKGESLKKARSRSQISCPVGESVESAPVAPRFRRVFHAKQVPLSVAVSDLNRLSREQLGWVEDLFFHRMKVVRYRDFKAVWLRLGGKVGTEDAVGSHFDLRDSTDRIVAGIFAHSESQEYSKHYHPVLRDALSMLGISKASF